MPLKREPAVMAIGAPFGRKTGLLLSAGASENRIVVWRVCGWFCRYTRRSVMSCAFRWGQAIFFSANAVRIFALWFQMRVSSMMGSFRDSQALTGVPGPELALRTVLLVKDSLAPSGIARPFEEAHRVRVGE